MNKNQTTAAKAKNQSKKFFVGENPGTQPTMVLNEGIIRPKTKSKSTKTENRE